MNHTATRLTREALTRRCAGDAGSIMMMRKAIIATSAKKPNQQHARNVARNGTTWQTGVLRNAIGAREYEFAIV